MEQAGLERAIALKGSQAKLAAAMGCTQQVISYYRTTGKKLSAELAVAIEEATDGAVPRWDVRPDLFPGPQSVTGEGSNGSTGLDGSKGSAGMVPEEELRARLYRLLAHFLAAPPTAEDLAAGAAMSGDDSPFGKAVHSLARLCARSDAKTVAREYHDLFVGVGRGELLPYASYYLTGFLNEKPLAVLRGDMMVLGIGRDPDVKEPEDHIAALMDMMAGLILGAFGEPASVDAQKRFFDVHIGTWAGHFFADLEAAKSSVLYAAVGGVGRRFMEIEETAFSMT